MARTIGQCIADARTILQDRVPTHRYPEAELYAIFTSAMSDARRLRPDLFLPTLLRPFEAYTEADRDTPFPITELYWTAVVNYVVGRAELRDDQYNQDSRAASLLSSFKALLSTAMA